MSCPYARHAERGLSPWLQRTLWPSAACACDTKRPAWLHNTKGRSDSERYGHYPQSVLASNFARGMTVSWFAPLDQEKDGRRDHIIRRTPLQATPIEACRSCACRRGDPSRTGRSEFTPLESYSRDDQGAVRQWSGTESSSTCDEIHDHYESDPHGHHRGQTSARTESRIGARIEKWSGLTDVKFRRHFARVECYSARILARLCKVTLGREGGNRTVLSGQVVSVVARPIHQDGFTGSPRNRCSPTYSRTCGASNCSARSPRIPRTRPSDGNPRRRDSSNMPGPFESFSASCAKGGGRRGCTSIEPSSAAVDMAFEAVVEDVEECAR